MRYVVRLYVTLDANSAEEARQILLDDLMINESYSGPEGSHITIDNTDEVEKAEL